MATDARRELWTDRSSGDAFVVEVEDDRVVAAEGPLDPDDLAAMEGTWTSPAEGRTPAFTGLATDLDRRRDEFERRPLRAS